jgi:predicted nucleic-acid-binding Zn-ribbon protein
VQRAFVLSEEFMGLFGEEPPTSVEVQGQVLKCHTCGHDEFHRREAQLNTAAATFFNMDWANASAVCEVCDRCGFIHWFLPR